jgi:hypothetical protein
MSLYNMIAGMNAELGVLMSPFLPRRADAFPRFRDIFTAATDTEITGDIYVYTRMGGGNRDCWESNEDGCSCAAHDAEAIEIHPQCLHRYDDEFDCTYSTFVFCVSDEDRPDYDALVAGKPWLVSDRYRAKLRELFAADGEKTRAFVELVCNAKAPE